MRYIFFNKGKLRGILEYLPHAKKTHHADNIIMVAVQLHVVIKKS